MGWIPKKYVSRYRGKNGMEYQLICPTCRKDNLWFNSTRQSGQCFTCPGNSRSGHLTYSARDLRLLFDGLASCDLDEALLNILLRRKESAPVIQSQYQQHWQAVWYLEKVRRLQPEVIQKAGLWYDEQRDRVCVPIHRIRPAGGAADADQESPPYMSRPADPEVSGWKVQPVDVDKEKFWFQPVGVESSPYIVLVEGAFDVLTPNLAGCAIALLGTALYEDAQLWLLDRMPRIVLWMDPDPPGRKASKFIRTQLEGICPLVEVDYEKEAGDCTPGEAQEVINLALQGMK